MGLERLEIALDRLLDRGERLLSGLALAYAAGQLGGVDGIAALVLGLQNDIEFTSLAGLHHAQGYASDLSRTGDRLDNA